MDFALISGLMTTLTGTVELGRAAVGVRDANQLAVTVAQMNDKLLNGQQVLFGLMADAMALSQDLADTKQENQKLKAALEQRGQYALVELSRGQFAYRSKRVGDGSPVDAEPVHHVCQSCFDKGVKVVLQRRVMYGAVSLYCHGCKTDVYTGETEPYSI